MALRGPNDIVFDAHGGFCFTDQGKARANDMDRGGVFYGRANGADAQVIAWHVALDDWPVPGLELQHPA